jgi:superfamily II RNA helicase
VAVAADLPEDVPAEQPVERPALLSLLPEHPDEDSLYEAFTTWAEGRGLALYPAQSEALIELVSGSSVVLSTPTGSGKSLVALGAHFAAMASGRRSVYTAPLKALVSEKFFALVEVFGAENVGMATGDASVNSGAPILCCTAEVLANVALREGDSADVGLVVMDEFHFYGDPQRGWAWQVPLVELPQAQFLLMSATLGDVSRFLADLERRTGRPAAEVTSVERPVPLSFEYCVEPLHEELEELLQTHRAPVYVVHFTQAAAVERAQALMSVNLCSREEKDAIAEAIGGFRFATGFGKALSRLVRHGIGVHHAGMLPGYRRLVEQLAQRGLLKVVCGTDTLGVGINVPIRTVLLTGLAKYDGSRTRHLQAREFHQIAGRAGRAGFDTQGTVVVMAPEHDIENARRVKKAGDDPKKLKRVERKKPAEGSVSWSEQTFERLVRAEPEPLTSSFRVTSSMLLNLVQRPGDAFAHARHLLLENDEPRQRQLRSVRRAIALYRSLLAADVVEPLRPPGPDGRTVRLTVDLPRDFALDQPLSPFALAALDLLDPASPDHLLDVVSVLEATLDDPRQVLLAQVHKAKGEAVAEMKAEGIEYEERMELLEDVSYPKPLVDLLEPAYETFRQTSPWIGDYELKPKSVARDLYERAMTFTEYVSFYGLARSEGTVLRYLADAYKALQRVVPDEVRTGEVADLTAWLGELVRQTDSSLLEEWERLADPDAVVRPPDVTAPPPPVTRQPAAFRVLVRNALWRRVQQMALRRWIDLGELDPEYGQDAWQEAVEAYFAEHDDLGTGASARGPSMLLVDQQPGRWLVRQVLEDPDDDRDWGITAVVDLAESDARGEASLRVVRVGRVDGDWTLDVPALDED